MRVLFLVTGCFDKGGISRYARYQISALRDLFGDAGVRALSLLGPDGTGFETPFMVHWHGRTGSLSDKIGFSANALKNALLWRPDVVHVAHVNMTPLAVRIATLCEARTLLNVYGLEIWSGLSDNRQRAMRAMDRIVADCHFTSGYVAAERLHASEPDVIWDCIDLDRFAPSPCPPDTLLKYAMFDKRNSFVILSLGRLDKRAAHKGFDRLIEVFAKVHREVERARLVIAGQGDDRPRLEALVARRRLGEVVRFIGAVDEWDLADVYRAATIFSLVSDRGHGRGEGIPLTPLEAMGCGVPIIVGNQDGSQEAVITRDGEAANGFVIDPFDIDGHARLIVQLAQDAARLARPQGWARQVAADHFGYHRFVDQHRALYDSLMRRTHGHEAAR
jgi:phosphatidylinositol alpha-1,6-mannosyltransferase